MSLQPYYQDDACTIYHGDCRDVCAAFTADLVIADPPYGINYHRSGTLARVACEGRAITGDEAPFDPSHLLRFPRLVLFGANHYADKLPPSGGWLVWDKVTQNGVRSVLGDAELAWTNLMGATRVYRHMWNGNYRASERGVTLHPTQKPVALMAWIIANWTQPGDVILDPFMGSGPVLRAAKDLGRRAIGIEIEERYCEIAARRLGQEVLAL